MSIVKCTMRLSLESYNPATWLNRAAHLFHLGYPELAAGDAQKAHMLAGIKMKSIPREQLEMKLRSLTLLAQALVAMRDPIGLHSICEQALPICPSHSKHKPFFETWLKVLEKRRQPAASRVFDREKQKLFQDQGSIVLAQYPFMSAEHMSRDKEAMDVAINTLHAISSNCSLGPRTFSDPSLSQAEGFGIYATTNIGANTRLFDDETILGATSPDTSTPSASKGLEICENCCGSLPIRSTSRVEATCCSTVYCSEHCRETALRFYHSKTCGRNFPEMFELQGIKKFDPKMYGPMWLRVLSICTQSDCHPLDHPLIARLIPQISDGRPLHWSYINNILQPIHILQKLGVDLWKDLRFDTWVLQTVLSRLINNRHEHYTKSRRYVVAVNSLYSFLNHSCEPNARWYHAQTSEGATAHDSTTISVIATKPIKKGEEICIDYNTVRGIQQKAQRQQRLRTWIPDGVCACTRCQREA